MKILTDFEKIQYMRLNMKYAHYDAYKDVDLVSYFLEQKQKENKIA